MRMRGMLEVSNRVVLVSATVWKMGQTMLFCFFSRHGLPPLASWFHATNGWSQFQAVSGWLERGWGPASIAWVGLR